jgi:hypothetical protein
VRGDSIRDLYAKTLALVGLALLGAIGALVDYWPAGGAQPPAIGVDAALRGPAAPAAIPVDTLANIEIEITPAPSRVARTAVAPALTAPAPSEIVVAAVAWVPETSGGSVRLSRPPVPRRSLAAPRPVVEVPAPEVALSVPSLELSPDSVSPELQFAALTAGQDRGFLVGAAGAAKKAGSTIANGTIKAGSTIAIGTMKAGAPLVSAVRVLGGAFKRLKFF